MVLLPRAYLFLSEEPNRQLKSSSLAKVKEKKSDRSLPFVHEFVE